MTQDEIDKRLLDADKVWTVPAVTVAVMSILEAREDYTLVDIERRLRELESRVYLIGMPMCDAPTGVVSMRPPKFKSLARYWIWFGLNGEEEARNELANLGISAGDNLRRLKHTGMLITKE